MVDILGTGLSIDDLKWLGILLFVAMIFTNLILNPSVPFLEMLDKKVFGYPVCEAVFCIAPSLNEINSAGNSFRLFSPGTDWSSATVILAIVGFALSIWVLLKIVLCIVVLWIPISYVQRWYGFWFRTFPMY